MSVSVTTLRRQVSHASISMRKKPMSERRILVVLGSLCLVAWCVSAVAQTPTAPKYKFDPDWPKTMPNKWKIGGVTGLAVDKDDNVWVYDRPNDLRDMELKAELAPATADCCVRAH